MSQVAYVPQMLVRPGHAWMLTEVALQVGHDAQG